MASTLTTIFDFCPFNFHLSPPGSSCPVPSMHVLEALTATERNAVGIPSALKTCIAFRFSKSHIWSSASKGQLVTKRVPTIVVLSGSFLFPHGSGLLSGVKMNIMLIKGEQFFVVKFSFILNSMAASMMEPLATAPKGTSMTGYQIPTNALVSLSCCATYQLVLFCCGSSVLVETNVKALGSCEICKPPFPASTSITYHFFTATVKLRVVAATNSRV